MKTKYILKTNNDLQFDFEHDDNVYPVQGNFQYLVKIQELEFYDYPLILDVNEEEYTITSITKIKE